MDIKMDFKEVACEGVEWIRLLKIGTNQSYIIVNTVINFDFGWRWGICWLG
jgi:hypothetical protein